MAALCAAAFILALAIPRGQKVKTLQPKTKNCPDSMTQVHDCQQNVLCRFGGKSSTQEDYPDKLRNWLISIDGGFEKGWNFSK